MKIVREFVSKIKLALQSKEPFIQVVIGPRQVGKTTGIQQLMQSAPELDFVYASADGEMLRHPSWITEQWLMAQSQSSKPVLIIDEIQKVEHWAEAVKRHWDQEKLRRRGMQVVLLGSSSLELQRGLSESLAGRFRLHKVYHWGPSESSRAYSLDLDQFLRFGGYPGSHPLVRDRVSWLSYVQDSILDPVIGKDILSLARVKSPSLFKQSFYLACSYAVQEISYTKLLGQLQERGNTDLIKHYLELFEQVFLLKQLFKFSSKKILARASSPKILPLCPALYSVTLDADFSSENLGRAFEIVVGCMLNQLPGELYYWRQRQFEVDYVYRFGKKIWAIEVKSSSKQSFKGLHEFKKEFPSAELLLLSPDNYESEIKRIHVSATS